MQSILGKILIVVIVVIGCLFIFKTITVSSSKPVSIVATENNPSPGIENNPSPRICEEERVKQIIKEYLISSPEVIIESIEGLQKRKVQEGEVKVTNYLKDNKTDIETTKNFPIMGNENGDITIVSFFDYNCSYCKKGDNSLQQLLQTDPNVKVLLRPLPILGDASEYLANIALAVFKINPEKFIVIHEGLMDMKTVTKDSVEELLSKNGLNISEVEDLANSTEIKDLIMLNVKIAKNLKIQGVPVYIINSKLFPGLIELSTLQNLIAETRESK